MPSTASPLPRAATDPRSGNALLSGGKGRFDRQIAAVTIIPFVAILVAHAMGGIPPWLFVLTFLLGSPHVLATFGLYADADIRKVATADPLRYIVLPLAVVGIAAVVFAPTDGRIGIVLVTIFLLWQTQHYTKQNVGMFAFWCRARGLSSMSERERTLIVSTTMIGGLGILRAMAMVPEWDALLRVAGIASILAGAVAAVAIGRGARTWALLASVAFYAPLFLFKIDLLDAAFSYQAAHGAQYYLMVGHTIRKDRRAVRIALPVIVIGSAIPLWILTPAMFVSQPWLFGLGKGLAAAHFIADASLWRLREPQIRTILIGRFSFLRSAPQVGQTRSVI